MSSTVFNGPTSNSNFVLGTTVTGGQVTFNLSKNTASSVRSQLPTVPDASFDSYAEEHGAKCFPGTRIELLRQIMHWAKDPNAKPIFWLNGMAGTGKSTISRTVSVSLEEDGILGASFFFKRGEADRSSVAKLFPTLASQLLVKKPALEPLIQDAINQDPEIPKKRLGYQFEKLILQPLSQLDEATTFPLIIVLDALDECHLDHDVSLLINVFADARKLGSRFKIFVTSRPEVHIRGSFVPIKDYFQDLVLHEATVDTIQYDISIFLKHQLAEIRSEYNSTKPPYCHLPSDWPDESSYNHLVTMAVPLFIVAATICRFIGDGRFGGPVELLAEVLELQTKSIEDQFDATYLPVLNRLILNLPPRQRDKVIQNFQRIVGSIIVLSNPLGIKALEALLNVPMSTMHSLLDRLHSVLDVPKSESLPIRLLHLSFRDFLTNPEKRDSLFRIDESQAHYQLHIGCFRLMAATLKENICGLSEPSFGCNEVDPEMREDYFPLAVQYAVANWAYHLREAGTLVQDADLVEIFKFFKVHFLHWLEALSLIGKGPDAVAMLEMLQPVLQLYSKLQFLEFLDDALKFILQNMYIVDNAPLQLYISGLAFAPRSNIIRGTFKNKIPNWITITPSQSERWDPRHLVLEGHRSLVRCCAFSADSSMIASASDGDITRIWNTRSGKCLRILHGHSSVMAVSFSPDSKILATGDERGTVLIRDLVTGQEIKKLKASPRVRSLVFSPDNTLLAAVSATLTVWRTHTWEILQNFDTPAIIKVIFSPNSSLLGVQTRGSASVWDVSTWTYTKRYDLLYTGIWTMCFLGDGSLLGAREEKDQGTINVFSFASGKVVKTIYNHTHEMDTLTFTEDLTLVASSYVEGSLHLWDISQRNQSVFFRPNHNHHFKRRFFFSVLSPDKTLLASLSVNDGPSMISLWKINLLLERPHQETRESFDFVDGLSSSTAIAVSPSSKYVAWMSRSGRLRLYYQDDHGRKRNLYGNKTCRRNYLQFSPDSTMLLLAIKADTLHLLQMDRPRRLGRFKVNPDSKGYFSPNSKFVATTWHPFVSLWTTKDCDLKWRLHVSSIVNQLVFSPDGAILASGSKYSVRLWRVETGQCIMDLGAKFPAFCCGYSLSFATDSNYLIATSTGLPENPREFSRGGKNEVSDQNDAIYLDAHSEFEEYSCAEYDLCAWRIDTGERVMELADPSARVAIISSDMGLIATQDFDGLITIRRGENAIQIIKPRGHIIRGFDQDASHIFADIWYTAYVSLKFPINHNADSLEENVWDVNPMPVGYRTTFREYWIWRDGCKALWIPSAYRHIKSIMMEKDVMVVSCSSGQVLIFK